MSAAPAFSKVSAAPDTHAQAAETAAVSPEHAQQTIASIAEGHPIIAKYLEYTEHTESPKIFHAWAFISALSAAMGRRCWYDMGIGKTYPNLYVILVGPPAVRKSFAFRETKRLLREHTGVHFAPSDTGGQRQGILAAMTADKVEGDNDDAKKLLASLAAGAAGGEGNDADHPFADVDSRISALESLRIDARDPHSLYIAASELNSIIGEGNTALMTFLQEMWDGAPYEYRLRNSTVNVPDGLLGMIAGTTPAQISLALPPESIGQGFTSRVIFVYADQKATRRIARPRLKTELAPLFAEIFNDVFWKFEGAFNESPEAAKRMDTIYEKQVPMTDPRFLHYAERRHDQLAKMCMALAASRRSMTIELVDVEFAHQLLAYTEQFMPEAMGEYGMNKLGSVKQKLVDMLKSSDEPVPVPFLYTMLSREVSQVDFRRLLMELHNAGKLSQVNVPGKGQCIIGVSSNPKVGKSQKQLAEISALLTKGK